MGNIKDNSMRMWAHVVAVWVFTAVVLGLTYREYSKVPLSPSSLPPLPLPAPLCLPIYHLLLQYADLRTRYNGQHKAHNYSIMVKDVPLFIKCAHLPHSTIPTTSLPSISPS
jgi:hypothetical protein